MEREPTCHIHPLTKLVCPRCIGAKGGKKTAKAHSSKLADWGRQGGRPEKKRRKKK